jgi:hypothetical protein
MDIFYYSNLCPHSQKVVQFIVKHQLNDKLSCICVDKRKRDVNNNQTVVILDNGKQVMLPPNLQSIPAILCVKKNYVLVLGTDPIIEYLQSFFGLDPLSHGPTFEHPNHPSTSVNRRPQSHDPVGFELVNGPSSNTGIYSEPFTGYNLEPEDLAGQSNSNNRPIYEYTPVDKQLFIDTPEDKYRPDKVSSNVTIDVLQQQRNLEIPMVQVAPPSSLYGGDNNNNGNNRTMPVFQMPL